MSPVSGRVGCGLWGIGVRPRLLETLTLDKGHRRGRIGHYRRVGTCYNGLPLTPATWFKHPDNAGQVTQVADRRHEQGTGRNHIGDIVRGAAGGQHPANA